jgi:hypothetical protein
MRRMKLALRCDMVGCHFRTGDLAGRKLGRAVADREGCGDTLAERKRNRIESRRAVNRKWFQVSLRETILFVMARQ